MCLSYHIIQVRTSGKKLHNYSFQAALKLVLEMCIHLSFGSHYLGLVFLVSSNEAHNILVKQCTTNFKATYLRYVTNGHRFLTGLTLLVQFSLQSCFSIFDQCYGTFGEHYQLRNTGSEVILQVENLDEYRLRQKSCFQYPVGSGSKIRLCGVFWTKRCHLAHTTNWNEFNWNWIIERNPT